MAKHNILLNTDSYKTSMYKSYPPGIEGVYSYIESRGGINSQTVFFGLQAFVKEYLLDPVTQADIDEADEIWTAHGLPFNREGWEYILKEHGGYIPVRIKAIPEGTVVPVRNVLATIENTDPKCFWLTTWLETALLRAVWYPTTVATNSRSIKELILDFLVKTGTPDILPFRLHDFGARGVSSYESSMLGAMAHLVNFMGTDTISGIVGVRKYYREPIAGFSIPASEHSISTAWGRENEAGYASNMIDQFSDDFGLVATVADTYDVFGYVDILGTTLREKVDSLAAKGKTLVVRPDSGDPTDIPVKVIQRLMSHFGYTVNEKGYKVLPNHVRVIQGDGINYDSIETILTRLKNLGISADNIAFGMGGALLSAPQRDDQKFAMKASAVKVNGIWKGIAKDPVTDPGKASKKGRLGLVINHGLGSVNYQTVPESVAGDRDILRVVFENGNLLVDDTFADIRKRAEVVLKPEPMGMYG
ncbi:MAG: nicotinate phosphoribosyltransferase [Anaerolineaceae bacterium]